MFCASNHVGIVGIDHWNYVTKPFGFCYLVAVRKTVSGKMTHLLWAPNICVTDRSISFLCSNRVQSTDKAMEGSNSGTNLQLHNFALLAVKTNNTQLMFWIMGYICVTTREIQDWFCASEIIMN